MSLSPHVNEAVVSTPSSIGAPVAARGDKARYNHPMVLVGIAVFAPILGISVLAWQYAAVLRSVVPIELTNLDAFALLLRGFRHASVRQDSWGPMLEALHTLRGPHWNSLYKTLFFGSHIRFQYPPTSLLSLDILSCAGLATVRALNALNLLLYLANAAAAGALAWLLLSNQRRSDGTDAATALHTGGMALIVAVAALLFYPNVRAVVLGQIQVWIDLAFTVALIAWLLQRRLLAGALIGLACTIKPQFALLLLWGLVWEEWAFVAGFVLAIGPFIAASLLRYGLHNHLAYLSVLSFLSRHGESYFANNSVNGILNGYFSSSNSLFWDSQDLTPYHPAVYLGTMAASVVAVAAIAAPQLLWRRTRAGLADLGAAAICTVMGSPVAWEHHYGILLPLYVVALQCLLGEPGGPRRTLLLCCLFLSWVLTADFIPFANLLAGTVFSFLQAYLFFGGALLAALLFLSAASPSFKLAQVPRATDRKS